MIVFTSTQTDLHGQAADMTTESKNRTRSGLSPLTVALGSALVAVLVLGLLAAVLDGRPAVVGALVGGGVTLAVFALGTGTVSLVARLVPAASLLVALMTYVLQLLVLALVVASIERADVSAGDSLARLVRGRRDRRDTALDGRPAGRRHPPADPRLHRLRDRPAGRSPRG